MEENKEVKEISEVERLFGIDQATFDKGKDIKPILQMGSDMDYNKPIKVEFLDKEPKEVETPTSKFKKTSRVIGVKNIDTGLELSMFISSKTLSMGISRLYFSHGNSLKGVKALIIKSKANFKNFGENDCYTVQELKE